MTKNKDSEWQKLDWARKVQICEQGRASENYLLHTYVVTFIALEAMFFAVVFSVELRWLTIIMAVLGIGLSVLFVRLFLLRGEAIDRWEEVLNSLWKQVDTSKIIDSEKGILELAKHYHGAVERRKRGRRAVFLGWGWRGRYTGNEERKQGKFWWFFRFFQRKGRFGPFTSARWVLVTLAPTVVVFGWILVVVGSFDC